MAVVTLCSIEGALMLPIPADVLAQLNLKDGAQVDVSIHDGHLTIKPMLSYSLEEMLAQCDPTIELTAEDRAWLDAKPMGREIGVEPATFWRVPAIITQGPISPKQTVSIAADYADFAETRMVTAF